MANFQCILYNDVHMHLDGSWKVLAGYHISCLYIEIMSIARMFNGTPAGAMLSHSICDFCEPLRPGIYFIFITYKRVSHGYLT